MRLVIFSLLLALFGLRLAADVQDLTPGVYIARDDKACMGHKYTGYYAVNCIYLSADSTFGMSNCIIQQNGQRLWKDLLGYGKWYVDNDSLYFDFSNSYRGDDGICVILRGFYSVNTPVNPMSVKNDTIYSEDATYFRVPVVEDSIPSSINSVKDLNVLATNEFFIKNFNDIVELLGKNKLVVINDSISIARAQEREREMHAIKIDSIDHIPIFYRDAYETAKDNYSWYPIGFIKPENHTLFRDNKKHIYLLTGYDGEVELSAENIIDRNDVYLVVPNLFLCWYPMYMTNHELYRFKKMIPDEYTDFVSKVDISTIKSDTKMNKLNRITSSPRPDGFFLLLMTGKAYNHITYDIIPSTKKPINFPDENAYYRVLMPLWRKAR